jgi:hypothetical protein
MEVWAALIVRLVMHCYGWHNSFLTEVSQAESMLAWLRKEQNIMCELLLAAVCEEFPFNEIFTIV